ncbi:MAG: discoidin domain-containing protein [Verrucomicrobiae bacterium]|nr:discoidin domain-containing protein [Verrucomicrobiae bacterium]
MNALCIAALVIELAGPWRFELDRTDAGIGERWFSRTLSGTVRLPGALPAQGIGEEITPDTKWIGGINDRSYFTAPEYEKYRQPGNIKVPFWLQPDKYYAGAAWYQREIEIPTAWQGKRIVLHLERPHWETRVWVDNSLIGSNNSLSTPHDYDLGLLAPGKHTLTIRVDNRMVIDVGHNSHSVSDHTQGNWNGIAGKIQLRATPPVWIDELQVFPNVARRSARVHVRIGNATGKAGQGTLIVNRHSIPVAWNEHGGTAELQVPVENRLWDEFTPHLQQLTVRLGNDQRTVRFGLREFTAAGTQFAINGRKTFIRGTLDCCVFPKTGHPPTTVAEWKRIIRIAKAHGLNLIRFHSWCPPEAAFIAADELGFYLHVEASTWPNQSTTLGDGKPVDQWIYEETDRILRYYGNHPSFVLMASGNEPGGKNQKAFLAKWVEHYKAKDQRRLWTAGAGWPELPENQWHCLPQPRIQAWGAGLNSRINAKPPETTTDYRDFIGQRNVPVVSHEAGQWCVHPNFDEIKKYTGYLKPKNFEIFRDRLTEHHMLDQARDFLLASGKLQALCYKEEIESALRTPGMAGFQLLDLHDFPGQGTALVGVLDPFWEPKGYITAEQFRRFCNHTVPLARLPKRVFTTDETLQATLEVASYGPSPVEGPIRWRLVSDRGKTVARGESAVNLPLRNIPAPARYKLIANIAEYENDWDLWVYPAQLDTTPPPDVKVVEELPDEPTGKILWLVSPLRVKNAATNKVVMGFSPIFWNTAWTRRQPPTTLGILCDPRHPMFAHFPTDFHSNWQWWYLVTRAAPMILDELPPALRPTVQVIDDWFTARKLGLVFEAKIGKANVVVCSIALSDANPVARQFLHSVLHYMASDKFAPKHTLTPQAVRSLFNPPLPFHFVSASSHAPNHEVTNAFDCDPSTIWHTAGYLGPPWSHPLSDYPHELTLEFFAPKKISGITCLPPQDKGPGRIKDFAIKVSEDGQHWCEIARGAFSWDKKPVTVNFKQPVQTRWLKFVAITSLDPARPYAALAELNLIEK